MPDRRPQQATLRVAYLLSHPIQYQSPLLRLLAQQPGLDLIVFYTSDFSARSYRDKGFGADVAWDVPLLEGYRHEVLPRLLDASTISFLRPLNRGLFSRLRRGRFDVLWIHGYATLNAWMAMGIAKLLRIPVLLRTDSTLIDHPRGPARLAVKRAFFAALRPLVYGVLSVGERNTEYWQRHLGASVPSFSIPYAVDNDFFRERSLECSITREQLRHELNLQLNRPVILFASKLLNRKRCIDLVEAYLCLRRKCSLSNPPYLLIIGDGEERLRIEERLSRARADECAADVRLLGFRNQSELPRFYDLCNVFVLPSIHEPWGLVVNEAMAVGRAVIVSDEVGCQPDLVIDNENGRVFPVRNVNELTAALHDVLKNPEACLEMGHRSQERIRQYTFEADIRGLIQAFTAAAERRNYNPNAPRAPV